MAEPIFIGLGTKLGTWNAATNSGSLTSPSVPTTTLFTAGASTAQAGRYHINTLLTASVGDYWQVSHAGTYEVDGYTQWQTNDYVVFVTGTAGNSWRRLSYTDTVSSLIVGQIDSQPLSNTLISGSCAAPNWVTPKPPCGPFADNKMILFVSGTVATQSASFSGSYDFVHDYTTGRVGIGTASPSEPLHVVTPANGGIEIEATAGAASLIFDMASNDEGRIIFKEASETRGGIIYDGTGAHSMIFKGRGNNTEVMRIDSGGNVGVGTVSPSSRLHIEHTDTTTWPANPGINSDEEYTDFLLTLRNKTDTAQAFAGIAFDVTTEVDDADAIGAAILAAADNATTTSHDVNLVFATNDAADDGLAERMRVTHDGLIGIGTSAPAKALTINATDGGVLRLIRNDPDGTSASYCDMSVASTGALTISPTNAQIAAAATILPDADNTRSLGSDSRRWANVYTGDLHLKNDRGDWTVVEEENYLCIINNKTGKKFKMLMEEID